MRQQISYDELRRGDIGEALGHEFPVIAFDGDYEPEFLGLDGRTFVMGERDEDAYGFTFWRNEPTTFECNAEISLPAESGYTLVPANTLILTGVGQEVPTGRVKVTMEHVK